MKAKFFLFSLLFALLFESRCIGSWQENWAAAVLHCQQSDFESAEGLFNAAIAELESLNDDAHPFVYVDRARLYLFLDRNEEVLSDIGKVIFSGHLTNHERIRAVVTRLMASARLGMQNEVLGDLRYFAEINKENMPIVEITDKHILVRNIPESKCYKEIMTCYYIHSGICKGIRNIHMANGIWVIDRATDFAHEDKICEACGRLIKVRNPKEIAYKGCKGHCDRATYQATAWCAKSFKKTWCQVACITAVYELQRSCHLCCRNQNDYQTCIEPFEDILGAMDQICNPAWD